MQTKDYLAVEIVQDDFDPELLPVFLEEGDELYPKIAATLHAWRDQPDDVQLERKLQRSLHTFKGSARMAGAMRVGELTHQVEDRVVAAGVQHSAVFWDDLQNCLERIGDMLTQLHRVSGTALAAADAVVAAEMAQPAAQTVPFARIGKRLYQVVRQTCKELNKKAYLELSGTEFELQRSVLEKMTAPFEHLLRNAIAHGLESPQQRERADKSPIGDICLSLHLENNEAVFEFSDDGAGLDIPGLRRKAVEKGLLQVQVGTAVSDEQIMQLIFAPGLSTASQITAISGRGVGMDVVRSEIAALGGHIDVSSQWGEGTRFIIHLPLSAV